LLQATELKIQDIVKEFDMNKSILGNKSDIVIRGHLIKKNWRPVFNNKQLRYFELYKNGEVRYYEDTGDKRERKG
jgi:hypothetical protein|tara:strand:+ start:560 stop:784 length:225 start_codon:yes stop_codon:yes gene_type:complete